MARIRTIKPEFPQSESMGRLSRDARLLFVQLWTIVDDDGKARAASRLLASLLYPYDDDAPALIDGWLAELEAEGCIQRYTVCGASYLQVCKWADHQKIDRPSVSKLPSPPSIVDNNANSTKAREQSRGVDADLVSSTLDLSAPDGATSPQSSKPGPGPDAYRAIYGRWPRKPQYAALNEAAEQVGMDRLREAIQSWADHGWSPTNVAGMVDVAKNGISQRPGKAAPNWRLGDPVPEGYAVILSEHGHYIEEIAATHD